MRIMVDKLSDDTIEMSVHPAPGEEHPGYDECLYMIITALDGLTRKFLETVKAKDKWKFREGLYDQLDYLFDEFLSEVFPEIKPNEFDLTPAAIVYAQDQIIEEAAKKGITYKEAMEVYEKKAQEYIKARKKLC